MAEPEKLKPKWGDLIALGVGAGLIAYFTQIRGNPKYAGPTDETWFDAALVVVPTLLALAVGTYLVYRLLGFIGGLIRRLLAR